MTYSHRYRTLHQCLEFARAAAMLRGWFVPGELHRLFVEQVGPVHRRTTLRYLETLELAGLVESRMRAPTPPAAGGPKEIIHYRWLGWPSENRTRAKP